MLLAQLIRPQGQTVAIQLLNCSKPLVAEGRCCLSCDAGFSISRNWPLNTHACLDKLHILGLRPLGALAFGERDALPFAQLFETNALDVGRVEKQVLRLARVNEA